MVSRDFKVGFLVSFDRSEVSTRVDRVHFSLKFRFRVEFFLFSRLGVVSLLCEWSWAIRLSATTVVTPDTPSVGLMVENKASLLKKIGGKLEP
jgi:hypothetical protein